MVVILASIPWLLPWDELKVPYLPSFHVVASIAPWIGSTIYHLFMNHNTVFTVVDLTAPGLTGCTTSAAGQFGTNLILILTSSSNFFCAPEVCKNDGFKC